MDEFGVLTERFGLKPQGKSAPMAASKLSNDINSAQTRSFSSNSSLNSKSFPHTSKSAYNSNSFGGSFVDDNDLFFGSQKPQSYVGGDDAFDIFGGFPTNLGQTSKNRNGSSDFGSVFSNSNFSSAKSSFDGDIVGGLNTSNSSSTDDIFGSYTSKSVPIDDLFGNFSTKPTAPSQSGSVGFDDLIPGFGSSNSSKKGDTTGINQSTFTSIDDPFVVLESTSTATKSTFTDPLEEFSQLNHSGSRKPAGSSNVLSALRPPPRPGQVAKSEKVRTSNGSSIHELEEFAMGKVRQTAKANKFREAEDAELKNQPNSADDLESFFGIGSRSSSVPKSRTTPSDPLFDATINNRRDPVVPQRNSSVASSGMRKASSTPQMPDDLFSMFGDISSSGEFKEIEGESEERRKARLDRHHRTKDRVAKAVADMNQRDLKTQHEQDERLRIAETMDAHIKRWAAGKEGNMRALLSSLQYVLWTESGWEPVSLTDLITSTSVKKVYRKATLCVHPDKVQQKGSTLEQKYTAEKVFDILKEAWTKFNKEELS
ncbi:auxilin-related protein 2 [Euphorbia lathyris]|uniref:auxilin-related protein 2 n=1 Tax=Euphorbia lathyris TaxID=212925 RepID=UPI0033138F66